MSKTSHGTLEDHRPLADSELDLVSGGTLNFTHIESKNSGPTGEAAPSVWVGCAWVPQWW